jgi:hypothetical protein
VLTNRCMTIPARTRAKSSDNIINVHADTSERGKVDIQYEAGNSSIDEERYTLGWCMWVLRRGDTILFRYQRFGWFGWFVSIRAGPGPHKH